MNGFKLSRVFAVVVLTVAMVGCAGSRGGCRSGRCHASSAGSVPPRRVQTAQAHADHDTPRGQEQQTCPVTGEKLGSMGPPVSVTVKGRTVKVCCDSCVAAVQKNPDKYLKIVDGEQSDVSKVRSAAFYDRSSAVASEPPSSGGHHH